MRTSITVSLGIFVISLLLFAGCSSQPHNNIQEIYHYPTPPRPASPLIVIEPTPATDIKADIEIIPPVPPAENVQEFTIEVNEFGASPSTIEVKAHDHVKIHIIASPMHVSQGIVVRSPYFTTKKLLAHDEDTISFIASNDGFSYGIYKYDSNKKVGEGRIIVNLN